MTSILARPQPITEELFEAFLRCRYKSKLRIAGAERQSLELAEHRKKLQDAYREGARQRLLGSTCDTADTVGSGFGCGHIGHRRTLLSELALATDGLSATMDVLQRTEPASGPGSVSCIPIQYCRHHRVGRVAKLMLAFRSIVFGKAKGDLPTHGMIVHGPRFAEQKIELAALQGKTERLLEELRAQVEGAIDTPLILNQHCPICEFRTICKAEATATDNLSLLGGMTEQQIKSQNQKGIFTVNQLSYSSATACPLSGRSAMPTPITTPSRRCPCARTRSTSMEPRCCRSPTLRSITTSRGFPTTASST
jgi:predicted RecB family nuclease